MQYKFRESACDPEIHLWANAGDTVVNIFGEWHHNEGKRWTFDISIIPQSCSDWLTPNYEGSLSVENIKEAEELTGLVTGISNEDAKAMSDFMNKYIAKSAPTISAHDGYYGV